MHHIMHYPVPFPVAVIIIAVFVAPIGWLLKRIS